MKLALSAVCVLLALATQAAPAAADIPIVGQPWPAPTLKSWLEGSPSPDDQIGKVVVHWFCKPKLEACLDDLARMYNMREQYQRIYVIAYINGTARDAKKLDPVRGDIGAGAVAFGKPVAALMKSMGIGPATMPMSIVIGTDGKVAMVTTTGDPEQLDRRDRKIAELIAAVHEFTLGTFAPGGTVKVGQSFELGVSIELASWLHFTSDQPATMTITPPPDVTCDATKVSGDKLKLVGNKLEAAVRCTAAVKGNYEAQGMIRFNFAGPRGAVGVGDEALRWKFVVRA